MQQRQLRVGDILDDYCPRERRLTNHAVVAMVGADVRQTRCTTCDAEHEYKHAKVPRLKKKDTAPALFSQVLASGPRKVSHLEAPDDQPTAASLEQQVSSNASSDADFLEPHDLIESGEPGLEEGPVHRPLIRAQLPRVEGQPPAARPAPDFTIRQPAGRANRFRPRHQRGAQLPQGSRNGNVMGGPKRGAAPQPAGGRSQGASLTRMAKRGGAGRKRSK